MTSQLSAAVSGKAILLVEDMTFSQAYLRLVLENAGHTADFASNGEEGVEAAQRRRYDLIIMDLNMPVMDGYAASRAIRNLPLDLAAVPVLALTAKADVGEAQRCRQAGMNGYLTKPFKPAVLLEEVERWSKLLAVNAERESTIWDRPTYSDLADRLGATRMEKALVSFKEHLTRSLEALRANPNDADLLNREAHDMVSMSGMLGFHELSEVSRRIMMAVPAAHAASMMQALEEAAARVLAHLDEMSEAARGAHPHEVSI